MTILLPAASRITVVVTAVVATAMTYPWEIGFERWVLGSAAVLVVVVLGQWRGLYLTTIARRRLRLLLRRAGKAVTHQAVDQTDSDVVTTVILQMTEGRGFLPLDVVVGYLDRFGIRAQAVRITSRDTAADRTTWIGLTISAAANLPALQARSSCVPLRGVAEATLRRLADELRGHGLTLTTSEINVPDLVGAEMEECWRAVADGGRGFMAAYAISTRPLPEVLDRVWLGRVGEMWTAVEITARGIASACAIRTERMPAAASTTKGLRSQRGIQAEALARLDPMSTKSLGVEVFPMESLETFRWSLSGVGPRHESQETRQGG